MVQQQRVKFKMTSLTMDLQDMICMEQSYKSVQLIKGYTVMYDTNTGRVYYSGMTMPDGSLYGDSKSDDVLVQYELDNNLNSGYDITYSQMQELLEHTQAIKINI